MFKTIEECQVELVAHTTSDRVKRDPVDLRNYVETDMDHFPAQAARVSFNNDQTVYDAQKDEKLIHYLAEHKHLTPFEYQHATLMIECPLFIRSQIHRHRTFSYNEISRRYTSDDLDFWIPDSWHKQAVKNKQGSDGVFALDESQAMTEAYKKNCDLLVNNYEKLIDIGVAREQARAILPQSLMTRFYMGGNLRNWAHFLQLRLDAHAQYEIQIIAQKCHCVLHDLWPTSLEALMK